MKTKTKVISLLCSVLLLATGIKSITGNAQPTYQLTFEGHETMWRAGTNYEVTVRITKTSGAHEPEKLTARWLIDGQAAEDYRNDDFIVWEQTYSSIQQRMPNTIFESATRNITFEILRDGTPISWVSTSVSVVPNMRYIGTRKVTGYTPAPGENGGYTVTCRGIPLRSVIGTCVATNGLSLGTEIHIDGIGRRTVMDTGCGNTIDVLVSSTREAWNVIGNQQRKIWIVE